MNNYCTNCGKRLKKDEYICTKCNTPMLDLPDDIKEKAIAAAKKTEEEPKKVSEEPKKYKFNETTIIYICLIIISIIILATPVIIIKSNSIKKHSVEPFVKNNYTSGKYKIRYINSGKCIIGESCIVGWNSVDCDGSTLVPGLCFKSQYHYADDCKAYYYKVKSDNKEFIVTAYRLDDNKYYVLEGKKILSIDEIKESGKIYNE